jgi:NADPH2:quinone reductase
MKAIVMNRPGGCEVIEYVDLSTPMPGAGQALVAVGAAGVNFMDIGVRQGSIWRDAPFPRRLGVEGAGRVVAVGEGVDGISPGQRVAWVYTPGSYAEQMVIPASALVAVPDEIDVHWQRPQKLTWIWKAETQQENCC